MTTDERAAETATATPTTARMMIGGESVDAADGQTFEVVNPATGKLIATAPLGGREDVDRAVAAARKAFDDRKGWASWAAGKRGRSLAKLADLIKKNSEELAWLESRNVGKPIGGARGEIIGASLVFDYYAGAANKIYGQTIPVSKPGLDLTLREPIGVVGLIVPWNFPLLMASWKVAPALAAGNTAILKPASYTPLTALRLGELALEAGLPEHVLTVIPGKGTVVGERFVTHPLVRKVCFTGSTAVGKRIMAGCAEQVKRVTLELGGKSSNIVFADADVAAAAAAAPYAVFDNAGQDCCARSRILVERSAYDEFLSLLEPAVTGMRVLDPSDEASEMGPLISADQQRTVQGYLDEVEVTIAGSTPGGDGFWVPPSVVTTEDPAARIWREEVFGPVVAVMPFDDEAHAVELANDTEYGLSGSIYTADLGRGLRVARAVEAGNLSVNSHASVRYWTPFGGYKQSGLGRELGPDAPMAFTEEKNVFIAH
jgi:acyl-CoA reductase-like NAD-dependent aldehyde dehydrogenase